jgi:hypothetical protein
MIVEAFKTIGRPYLRRSGGAQIGPMKRNPGSVSPAIRVAESDAFFLQSRFAMGIGPCCDPLSGQAMVFDHDPGPSPKSVAKSPETE